RCRSPVRRSRCNPPRRRGRTGRRPGRPARRNGTRWSPAHRAPAPPPGRTGTSRANRPRRRTPASYRPPDTRLSRHHLSRGYRLGVTTGGTPRTAAARPALRQRCHAILRRWSGRGKDSHAFVDNAPVPLQTVPVGQASRVSLLDRSDPSEFRASRREGTVTLLTTPDIRATLAP